MAIHSTTCMLVILLFVYSGHSLFSCACVYLLCINTTHTCRPLSLCCSDMSSGVKFCSLKALPLKVEVVKLSSCFSHSKETKGVCECKCIQLFLAELINPLSRLTPHCHSPVKTHTHTHANTLTHTYILHAVFIGLNDGGWLFSLRQKRRDKLSARPAAPVQPHKSQGKYRKLEIDREVKVNKWKANNERIMRERQHLQKIKYLITLNKLSPLAILKSPDCF